IERLFSSSLTALVSNQSPRKLKVCHFKKGTEICSYSFANTILSVKLNRQRLIVCLEESIYIHNMRDMKVLHTIRDVPSNREGLCALSSNSENSYLAYPGSSISVSIIAAHDSPLAAIAFDITGKKIATASNKGTVIRVFNSADGARLYEFRRGVKRIATIHSLTFSPDGMFLAASSNTETIHIFRLTNTKDKAPEETSSWMGYFGRAFVSAAHYLPTQASEVLTQDRAFATVHLQSPGMKTTCAMTVMNKILKLFVAGYDGVVCIYEVNTVEGGECKQLGQYLLFNMSANNSNGGGGDSTVATGHRNSLDGVRHPSMLQNETIPQTTTATINSARSPSAPDLDEENFPRLNLPQDAFD
ncbi:unnamed protein product, partial [Didymodactylos carnosus]